jgi:ribonuclease HI
MNTFARAFGIIDPRHTCDEYSLLFTKSGMTCRAHPPLEGDILKYAVQLEFPATNNIIEYEGLVTDLRLAKDLDIRWLLMRGDLQLVAKQVQKEYDWNNGKMAEYLAEVHMMEKFFDRFDVRYVPQLDNRNADHLAWFASSRAPTPPDVVIEKLSKHSVKPAKPTNKAIEQDLMVIDKLDQEPVYDCMHPMKMFLENQSPLDDSMQIQAVPYCRWNFISMRHQWHDDEVHIRRGGHPTTPGHSQCHMMVALIMVFNH